MRIVTYNTRGSLGMDGKRSTARISDTLRALSPDIICFQEIHQRLAWSRREDQPAVLAQQLARPFLFQRNLTVGFGGFGNGMAVRGTVVARKEHSLPSRKEQRGALEVRLRGVGGLSAVTVFCTHWGLSSEERVEQAEALAELVNAAARPVIVCGDLNEQVTEAGVQRLLSLTRLQDADSRQNRATFVSDNPTVRIDFVLYSPELVVERVEVVPSLASDHLPLLVDFSPTPR